MLSLRNMTPLRLLGGTVHTVRSHGHQTPSPDMTPAGRMGGMANRGVDLHIYTAATLYTKRDIGIKIYFTDLFKSFNRPIRNSFFS